MCEVGVLYLNEIVTVLFLYKLSVIAAQQADVTHLAAKIKDGVKRGLVIR